MKWMLTYVMIRQLFVVWTAHASVVNRLVTFVSYLFLQMNVWYPIMYLFSDSKMIKAKKYDWKDSNMALFGSDTDKQVKSK